MRRIANYEVREHLKEQSDKSLSQLFILHKGNKEKIINAQLSSTWLNDEDCPTPKQYKKSWRYYVCRLNDNKDMAEYKDREQAIKVARLYGKNYYVRSYTPTRKQLEQSDAEIRKQKRYASGFGG